MMQVVQVRVPQTITDSCNWLARQLVAVVGPTHNLANSFKTLRSTCVQEDINNNNNNNTTMKTTSIAIATTRVAHSPL